MKHRLSAFLILLLCLMLLPLAGCKTGDVPGLPGTGGTDAPGSDSGTSAEPAQATTEKPATTEKTEPSAQPDGELNSRLLSFTLQADGTYAVRAQSNRFGGRKSLVIPAEWEGKPVTAIAASGFRELSRLQSVSLPESLRSIGDLAFEECSSLSQVNLPAGLRSIGESAFSHTAIRTLNVPDSVTFLGDGAFLQCLQLTSVTLGSGLQTVSMLAFWYCDNLRSVKLGSGVKTIEDAAFEGCRLLDQVSVPASLERIGSGAFRDVTAALDVADLAAFCGVEISETAFTQYDVGQDRWKLYVNGKRVTDPVIPEGVTALAPGLFFRCSLTSITIPSTLTFIGQNALPSGGYRLVIPDAAVWCGIRQELGDALEEGRLKPSLIAGAKEVWIGGKPFDGTLTVPDGVTAIADGAFAGWGALERLILPAGCRTVGGMAFMGCTSLTALTLPDGVETVGSFAFANCRQLELVQLGGVRRFAKGAFANSEIAVLDIGSLTGWLNTEFAEKSGNPGLAAGTVTLGGAPLTELVIPDGTVSIPDYAFCGFGGVQSVSMPESVTKIGAGAFRSCTELTSVILSPNVTKIGESAFRECEKLTSVVLPAGLTGIGAYAFADCTGLTEIAFPSGLRSIGTGSFARSGLKTVVLPGSLTTLGQRIFEGCRALTSAQLSSGMTTLPMYLFDQCEALRTLWIPASITRIDGLAVDPRGKLEAIHITDLAAWCSITYGVTGQQWYGLPKLYLNGTQLEDLVIPEGVTKVAASAFSGIGGIRSIRFSPSVTEIGDYAFEGCSARQVVIPGTVRKIGCLAFSSCDSLYSLTLEEGITTISDQAFSFCGRLTEVRIPDSVTVLGNAFIDCRSLLRVTIGRGVQTVPDRFLFDGCSRLEEVINLSSLRMSTKDFEYGAISVYPAKRLLTDPADSQLVLTDGLWFRVSGSDLPVLISYADPSIPERSLPTEAPGGGRYRIGEAAFRGCRGLKRLTIPGAVTEIGAEAFAGTELETLVIGDGVERIAESAFLCLVLSDTLRIPGSVKTIGANAFQKSNLAGGVAFEDGLQEIGDSAFYECTNLQTVSLPDSVEKIGSSAFAYCELKEVTFGRGVKEIKWNLFKDYRNHLEVIYFRGTRAEWNAIKKESGWNRDNVPVICADDGEQT